MPISSRNRHTLFAHPIIPITLLLAVLMNVPVATAEVRATMSEGTGRAPKPYVGSAMAVLATLEQAQVLPPENTPEANRIIKAVIQFQSVFAHSDDPAVRHFATQALSTKYGERQTELIGQFRSSGWTAAFIEALADSEQHIREDDLQALAPGFRQFNLSPQDFHQFMGLVREARRALETKGLTFDQVYASHRRTMPGASVAR